MSTASKKPTTPAKARSVESAAEEQSQEQPQPSFKELKDEFEAEYIAFYKRVDALKKIAREQNRPEARRLLKLQTALLRNARYSRMKIDENPAE